MQMCLNIMLNLCIFRLDVTRNVQVVVILLALNLTPFNHTTEMRDRQLSLPRINNTLDVLFTKTVFCSVLHESIFCIYEENTLTAILVFLVYDNDRCRNTRTEENIRRKSDDTLYITLLDNLLTDFIFGIATEQYTMRQDTSTTTFIRLHGSDEVHQESIVTTLGRWK